MKYRNVLTTVAATSASDALVRLRQVQPPLPLDGAAGKQQASISLGLLLHTQQRNRLVLRPPADQSIKKVGNRTALSGKSKRYNHRESNPGYLDGNEICYHYTMIVVVFGRAHLGIEYTSDFHDGLEKGCISLFQGNAWPRRRSFS